MMSILGWEFLKAGDLIKLHLSGENNFYVGYVWYTSRKEFDEAGEGEDRETHLLARGTYYGIRNADIFLSPISPDGIDKTADGKADDFNLEFKIQMTGINTKNDTFCGAPVTGYNFLTRADKR